MRKRILAASLLSSLATVTAFGGPKVAPELNAVPLNQTVSVIVRYNQVPGSTQLNNAIQRGGKVTRSFANINQAAYSIPASSLLDLAVDPTVQYVAPDRPVHGLLDYSAAAINAPAVLAKGFNGTGITVAVVDSGMNASPDLNPKQIVLSQDFTGEYVMGANPADPKNAPDTFGHGQHVAGILASNGTTSQCAQCTRSITGISPGVKLVNFRVLDENGNGSDSAVIAAIDEAIALKTVLNIRVLNLSVGRPVFESYTQDPLCQAVEQAWKAGIVVVVAAGNNGRDNSYGNNGYGTITAPGNDPYVITVGAMKTLQTYSRTDDLIASYSSKGPSAIDNVVKPDLVAPGNLVVSLLASPTATLAQQNPSNIPPVSYYMNVKGPAVPKDTAYFNLSGTSMATPVVSAAAADLLQAQPSLTPDQVKARLMLTAYKTFPTSSVASDPLTGQSYLSYYDVFTVGAGYLDLAAALASTAVAQGSAMSPTVSYDPASNSYFVLVNNTSVWTAAGDPGPFSLTSVWPNGNVSGQSVAWGQRVSATSVAWGQHVSPTSVAWGQHMTATSFFSGSTTATSTSSAEAATVAINGEQ